MLIFLGSSKFINQVDRNSNATGMTVRGVRRCCICNAVDGTDDDMLWNGITEVENVRSVCVCVKNMKALTVRMKTATLGGTGR